MRDTIKHFGSHSLFATQLLRTSNGHTRCSLILDFRSSVTKKSNCSQMADMIIASKTVSGCHIGRWIKGVQLSSGKDPPDWSEDCSLTFSHPDGTAWTLAHCFRFRHLHPALEAQHETDPLLCAFDGTPGNSVCEKFWSPLVHCCRQGARSHVSRGVKKVSWHRCAAEAQVCKRG